jgi:hypothetical protein
VDRQGALHNDVMFASSDCLILGGIDLKPYEALARYFGEILLIRSSARGIAWIRPPPKALCLLLNSVEPLRLL